MLGKVQFSGLALAFLVFGGTACGPINEPSNKGIAPLTPSQRERFERTVQIVGEVTQWKATAGLAPAMTEELGGIQIQEDKKAQVFRQMGERCTFVNAVRPKKAPTPTPAPAADKPKTMVVEKGIMSKKKGELECPITFDWTQTAETTYSKNSTSVLKTVITEEVNFMPESADAKGGLNVQKYVSSGKFQRETKAEREVISGAGKATLVLLLDGIMQTVVVKMSATGFNKGGAGEAVLSYYFVYGDGMRVELKSTLKAGAAMVYTLNELPIEEKEFEAYLAKFVLPKKVL